MSRGLASVGRGRVHRAGGRERGLARRVGARAAIAFAGVLTLTLAIAAPRANAGTVIGPPMSRPTSHTFLCLALNVGKRPVEVTSEVFTGFGSYPTMPIASVTEPVLPGNVTAAASSGSASVLFCRFTFSGSRSGLRFSAELLDAGGAVVSVIELR